MKKLWNWLSGKAKQEALLQQAAADISPVEADRLLDAFAELLAQNIPPARGVADAALLPASKERMKAAIASVLLRTEMEGLRYELAKCYLYLAEFQPDVAAELGMSAQDFNLWQVADNDGLLEPAESAKLNELLIRWRNKVRAELAILDAELNAFGIEVDRS